MPVSAIVAGASNLLSWQNWLLTRWTPQHAAPVKNARVSVKLEGFYAVTPTFFSQKRGLNNERARATYDCF